MPHPLAPVLPTRDNLRVMGRPTTGPVTFNSGFTMLPRWAQLSADRYLFKKALSKFHQAPFTVGVLVSFFKIKQLEEQMIRVAAEGLRLGATDSQMNDFMGDGRDA